MRCKIYEEQLFREEEADLSNFSVDVQIQLGFQGFAWKGWQLHQVFVQENYTLNHVVDVLQDAPGEHDFPNLYKLEEEALPLQFQESLCRFLVDQGKLRVLCSFEEVKVSSIMLRIMDHP